MYICIYVYVCAYTYVYICISVGTEICKYESPLCYYINGSPLYSSPLR